MKHYNAADENQVKKAGQRQKLAEDRYDDDFEWLMQSPRGRRLMWAWLSECGVYTTSFTGNSTTFFNEGRREIGLKRMADIHRVCPNEYVRMINEAQAEANE